jgi:UTP--glucose-1-phosphate uridylyltransferase
MHVLTHDAMELIEQLVGESADTKPTLSDAAARLPSRGRYLAYQVQGTRYNLGIKYGLLIAQLAIGLSGSDRDEILTAMVDLLAQRPEVNAAP